MASHTASGGGLAFLSGFYLAGAVLRSHERNYLLKGLIIKGLIMDTDKEH
jgi:hypothetical protein